MRSANPALNNNTFRNTRRVSGEQAMSIDGTVNKTALSLLLVMTSAIYTWNILKLIGLYFGLLQYLLSFY